MNMIGYINISLEIFGAIISLFVALCMMLGYNVKNALNRRFLWILICNIIVLLSDAAAWGFKGKTDLLSYWIVHIANFCVYVFGYVLLSLFTDYIVTYISTKTRIQRTVVYVVRGLCIIAIILVVVSQFNHMYYFIDENNIYQRQSGFWFSQVWAIVCMSIDVLILFKYHKSICKREKIVLASYIILPVVSMSIQIFIYGVALLYIATTISILMIYIGVQVEQARVLKEKELELAESRIAIMLSQIQPHFLYNSLTAISRLCDTDSVHAKKAIIEFSTYLRGNLESLTQKALVPLEREIKHVKVYLSLEKMRFDDELTFKYDIQTSNFLIPALTIQPLVENAVCHGVGKKENGGTVTISTNETEKAFLVIVNDDGVGFDTNHLRDDDRHHIGIQNVRYRLFAQCQATLTIKSMVGVGTTAIIKIPKGV